MSVMFADNTDFNKASPLSQVFVFLLLFSSFDYALFAKFTKLLPYITHNQNINYISRQGIGTQCSPNKTPKLHFLNCLLRFIT